MKRQLIWMATSIAALGAGMAGAQTYSSSDYRHGSYDAYGQTVRCESRDSRTKRCRINDAGEVRIARQLSRTQCIQGRNWDYSRREIRVTDGCRADFAVLHRNDDRYGYDDRGRYDDRRGYGHGQVIRCESRTTNRTYCGDSYGQYQMIGYRNGNCVQGRTFGQDSRGLWVSDRCSAQFRRMNDDDRNRDDYSDGNGYGNEHAYGQTVRCISNSSGRTYCGDGNARYSLLDTGNRHCVEGRTYGTDSRGLWVRNPCQADFTRHPHHDDGNDRYRDDRYGQQPYYQRD